MNDTEPFALYISLLTDSWTFFLTFSGILVSVITLLYSFILGKRSELEVYAEQSKLGDKDPLLKKRQTVATKHIKRLVSINKWCTVILSMSVISCFVSWFSIRFIPERFYSGILIVISVMALMMIAGTIGLIRRLYKQYKNDTII